MEDIKCVLFDCMETLVDIEGYNLPRDYAFNTFHGSGVEHYWNDFEHFYEGYMEARTALADQLPENKEYSFLSMYRVICESNPRIGDSAEDAATKLLNNHWENYISGCSVSERVTEALSYVETNYQLGIVGNLKVEGGIEALLEKGGIRDYFDFIIASVSVGWRKPDRRIYDAVLNKTRLSPEQHLFVGDDYENDFSGPASFGMKTLLYDRKGNYPHVENSISSFSELLTLL